MTKLTDEQIDNIVIRGYGFPENYVPMAHELLILRKENQVLREGLKHLANDNYHVIDEGRNYQADNVVCELYSDKPLKEWCKEQITAADKIREGLG